MPVSGRELASLDFGNLIGGPLNAIVEAQAKSAIMTANFIKEVGFTKDNKIVNVEFIYNRKNENGSDEEFALTLPFLSMLPIPYISISYAEVEFNAKITSTTESKTEDNFATVVDASAGGSWWFASARVNSKTAYQKKSSSSDKEERTFDMHVRVEARNVDMPAGTERILTLLENTIQERSRNKILAVGLTVKGITGTTVTVEGGDIAIVQQGFAFEFQNAIYAITGTDAAGKTLTLAAAPGPAGQGMIGKSLDVKQAFQIATPDPTTKTVDLVTSALGTQVKTGDKLSNGAVTHIVTKVDSTTKAGTVTLTFDDVTGFAKDQYLIKH